jgi:hypothetical protein
MTDWSFESTQLDPMDQASLTRKIFTRGVPVVVAMTFSAVVALRLAGGLASQPVPPDAMKFAKTAPRQTVAEIPTLPPHAPPLRSAAAASQGIGVQGIDTQRKIALESRASAEPSSSAAPRVAPEPGASASPYGELFDPDYAKAVDLMADARPLSLDSSLFQGDPMYKPDPQDASQTQVAEAEPAPEAESAPQGESAAAEAEPAAPLTAAQNSAAGLGLRLGEQETVVPQPPARPDHLGPSRLAKVEEEEEAPSAAPAPDPHAKEHAERLAPRVAARRLRGQPQMQAENDPRNFFEKLFSPTDKAKGPQLAYAAPGDGGLGLSSGLFSSGGASGGTAVYNIAAHTVTLPNGTQLEAHSGLGELFDNPNGVHVRMRGSTPPAVYKLTLRESLFHGVQALRLIPLAGNVHGRSGLLAHTFMLGQRGDSNGCVSFRNYRAFLQAFQAGQVRQLRVVSGG